MIRAENIRYEYIRRDDHDEVVAVEAALDAVSFRVQKGEFIGILGANGSGKSTLARHLNALLLPEEGTVYVDDIDTTEEGMTFRIREKVGMIFQNPDNQIVSTIIEDDVAFGPENLGVPMPELRERVDNALELVGMKHEAKGSPERLSGGQKSRIAIAGVLAMKPKCMVFDEATAMVDPEGREEILDELNKLRLKGITIIWITHHSDEVVRADRIFVMDKGKLVMQGKPSKVFADVKKIRECGLDVPAVTALAYELKKKGKNIPDGIIFVQDLAKFLV
ncbi:MAG: energy-coupling factor transporter ATPase [Eubacterium sp.]|nr:energy-coupling factor transporter ATPase [Eubacterium sp.]